ncbi:MAG: outer membrane lipoprotein chaperone LolA [Betaproteobacteria bacterium]|nr:outer membrane lipoprotein chaperone LolA [Betaproteobacteria bacterium]
MRVARGCAVVVALTAIPAFANALADFDAFVSQTQTGRATFEQTVTDARGKVTQRSNGQFSFVRPGKFRWSYDKPAQLIVGDAGRVTFFDPDLNQVTIRKLEQAFSSTPAALLSGKNDIATAFTLVAQPDADGLRWLEAIPRSKDAGIEKIRMGFAKGELTTMELGDAFGNKTRLAFARFEKNARIPASDFAFTPPKGADVIGP